MTKPEAIDKPTISAVVVVHNEAHVIRGCFESIKDVVDEIVVVHDGPCEDTTLEIACEYGARIFVRPRSNGSAEVHRPFSYKVARGEWILQIDGDERLSPGLRDALRELVADKQVDAYRVRWPYTNNGVIVKGFENETKAILFRKSKLYMLGITHESPQTYGFMKTRSDLVLEHQHRYDNYSAKSLLEKHLRWSALQADEIMHRYSVPSFGITDKETNPLFRYYKAQVAHPYWFAIKRYIIFDIAKKLMRRNPFYIFIVNWKVSLFFYISVLYTAHKISKYKREMYGPSFVAPGISTLD